MSHELASLLEGFAKQALVLALVEVLRPLECLEPREILVQTSNRPGVLLPTEDALVGREALVSKVDT